MNTIAPTMLLQHTLVSFSPLQDKPAVVSSLSCFGNYGSVNGILRVQRWKWRQRLVLMQQRGDRENSEEPPETLFMKELRRRGIASTSNDDERSSGSADDRETNTNTSEKEDVSGSIRIQSSGSTTESRSRLYDERSMVDQRQRSMALNSEGLEGLIPRAQALLSLGGTFFTAFWPLILSSLTVFAALYFYYGPIFIHSGSRPVGEQEQYVDPYELLEKERIPPEIGPPLVPYSVK